MEIDAAAINAPKPLTKAFIDDPKRDIETKIVVYDMAPDHPIVEQYLAQVYRRKGGVGEWALIWTTEDFMDDDGPLRAARKWHREHPDMMQFSGGGR